METVKWNVLTVCIFPVYLDLYIKQMSIMIPYHQQFSNQMCVLGSVCSLCGYQYDSFSKEK